jgi:hypothetical protein
MLHQKLATASPRTSYSGRSQQVFVKVTRVSSSISAPVKATMVQTINNYKADGGAGIVFLWTNCESLGASSQSALQRQMLRDLICDHSASFDSRNSAGLHLAFASTLNNAHIVAVALLV